MSYWCPLTKGEFRERMITDTIISSSVATFVGGSTMATTLFRTIPFILISSFHLLTVITIALNCKLQMNFDSWKTKLKEAAHKAVGQLDFDEMARKDNYIHQEGLNVVRKKERAFVSVSTGKKQKSTVELRSDESVPQRDSLPVLVLSSSSSASVASSTRSVPSMRQNRPLSSMDSDGFEDYDMPLQQQQQQLILPLYNEVYNENDDEEEEQDDGTPSRKNKLRFLQDLDHRLSKPNQKLELPLYTNTKASHTPPISSVSATANKKQQQPLWAKKSARSQSHIKIPEEDETPLIVTTTSSAVLDDSELQALAALQQQQHSSLFVPSFLLHCCMAATTRIPCLRQYPKITGGILILAILYLLRVYSQLAVPVDGMSTESIW